MIAGRALVMIAVLACGVAAQFPDQRVMETDFERFHEEKLKSAAREDRLHEMFYRHALGLPVDVTQLFAMTKAEAAIPRARAEEDVRRIRKGVRSLIKEYETLKLQVKRAQIEIAKPARPGLQTGLPGGGSLLPHRIVKPGPAIARTIPRGRKPGRRKPGGQPVRHRPVRHRPGRRRPTTRPSGQILLIKGSSDHSQVGRVLFRAGKYDNAIQELESITGHQKADIIDMFHLALSYEKQARAKGDDRLFAKANDLYSKIEARDSREDTAGNLIMGRWGKAARTARQTMLWLLDKGEWTPVMDVKTIQWEKAGQEEPR
jgi:hypothetical protein